MIQDTPGVLLLILELWQNVKELLGFLLARSTMSLLDRAVPILLHRDDLLEDLHFLFTIRSRVIREEMLI